MKRGIIIFLFTLLSAFFLDAQSQGDANSPTKRFVNRTYISLLGQKPSRPEAEKKIQELNRSGLNPEARKQFVLSLLNDPRFAACLARQFRSRFLEHTSAAEIEEKARDFQFLLTDSSLKVFHDIIRNNRDNLKSLENAEAEFSEGKIDIAEFQMRFVRNWYFDQINMGTHNFVNAVFVHFLHRFPGKYELSQAKNMVDGMPALVLTRKGKSKKDFLRIFFESDPWYACLVQDNYRQFLYRDAEAEEVLAGIRNIRTQSYRAFLADLIASDEFFKQSGNGNMKSDEAFYSIAWSDLFGVSIPPAQLENLLAATRSFGDQEMVKVAFLHAAIFSRNENNEETRIFPFPEWELLPESGLPETAAGALYFLQRSLIVKNENYPAKGENEFRSFILSQCPSASSLLTLDRYESFRTESEKWKSVHPAEFEKLQVENRNMLALWMIYDTGGWASLRNKIIRNASMNSVFTGFPAFVPGLSLDSGQMMKDPEAFIRNAYETFFMRAPLPKEKEALLKVIHETPSLSPGAVILGMMQSEEYRRF